MLTLNNLRDNKGAKRNSKMLGRGIGSGKGKTCGRGGKGQTARSGVTIGHRVGGQLPLFMILPKRGFKNINRVDYEVVNVGDIQKLIDSGKVSANDKIDHALLQQHGLCRGELQLKLLGTGTITSKCEIVVCKASKSAIAAVEAAKGSVVVG